ncbi:Cysteine desulfurase SufS [Paraconexibacter sp. AEG42_29]|uniref:cysteine desulfurase n=1 Tax=Paraconexibacter sp. AEG42_29 TaxID=2997339 RepID=A0AAU7B026_9ACTN
MTVAASGFDVSGAFPTLERDGLVYLDSAATSQTPLPVLAAMDDYYRAHRASVHRGVYPLAEEATELYENARGQAAALVGWGVDETIFTRNASEATNLVAYTWARTNLRPGDRVLVTVMEHHSNIVPWQLACEMTGATMAAVPVTDDGLLDLDALDAELAVGDVKLVAVAHVSNVLGTINPVQDIVARAHSAGAVVLVDGTQAVPQMAVDAAAIDADFYVWTAHKAYGPTGIGILHGRRELLEAMPPFIGGGHMISTVTIEKSTWAELPGKFEAGTGPIAEAIGMGAALTFLEGLGGLDAVRAHELDVTAYALTQLADVPGLTIHGPLDAAARGGLVSFHLDCAHPHDIAEILGRRGVCVRAGHHCAQPLMKRLGIAASTRASFGVHNSTADVDQMIAGLGRVIELFGD